MTINYRFDGISFQLLNKYHLSLTAFTTIKSQCNERKWKGIRYYMFFTFVFVPNALSCYYHLGTYPAYAVAGGDTHRYTNEENDYLAYVVINHLHVSSF